MTQIDLMDERFLKLYEEVQSHFDPGQREEVYVFDYQGDKVQTRTAVIKWDNEQFLITQSHYWIDESEPVTVRLPAAAIKFMCADLMARSITAAGFKVSNEGYTELEYLDWQERE